MWDAIWIYSDSTRLFFFSTLLLCRLLSLRSPPAMSSHTRTLGPGQSSRKWPLWCLQTVGLRGCVQSQSSVQLHLSSLINVRLQPKVAIKGVISSKWICCPHTVLKLPSNSGRSHKSQLWSRTNQYWIMNNGQMTVFDVNGEQLSVLWSIFFFFFQLILLAPWASIWLLGFGSPLFSTVFPASVGEHCLHNNKSQTEKLADTAGVELSD